MDQFEESTLLIPSSKIFEGIVKCGNGINNVCEEIWKEIGHNKSVTDLVFENSQAWTRKFIELTMAIKFKGIVLGTGDLSELMLGWCTMFGDHASHYNVNCSVPKTLISDLILWKAFHSEKNLSDCLKSILNTKISPELLPAINDEISQDTEENVGPYDLNDFFSYYFIRFGFSPLKIYRLAIAAFIEQSKEPKYNKKEIKEWLLKFLNRFFNSQFKRNCVPDGPKLGSIGVSPRGDWRMPSDIDKEIWLKDLSEIDE